MSVLNNVGQGELDDLALAKIVERLVAELAPECIFLFGSRARGNARPDSDYDLMLMLAGSEHHGLQQVQRAYAALGDLTEPIDVLVLNHHEFWRDAPVIASLPATILREGKLLYATS